jgi:hypothetical protein
MPPLTKIALSALACAACTSNGGGPGELGVYVVAPDPTMDSSPPAADATTPADAVSVPSGSCQPGHYMGAYMGRWSAAEAGFSQAEGFLDLHAAATSEGAPLAVSGTWPLIVASASFDTSVSGTLDCTTSVFRGSLALPGTQLTGVLGATFAGGSLSGGQFSITFDSTDPPMLGVTPGSGLSGTFSATWVGP